MKILLEALITMWLALWHNSHWSKWAMIQVQAASLPNLACR